MVKHVNGSVNIWDLSEKGSDDGRGKIYGVLLAIVLASGVGVFKSGLLNKETPVEQAPVAVEEQQPEVEPSPEEALARLQQDFTAEVSVSPSTRKVGRLEVQSQYVSFWKQDHVSIDPNSPAMGSFTHSGDTISLSPEYFGEYVIGKTLDGGEVHEWRGDDPKTGKVYFFRVEARPGQSLDALSEENQRLWILSRLNLDTPSASFVKKSDFEIAGGAAEVRHAKVRGTTVSGQCMYRKVVLTKEASITITSVSPVNCRSREACLSEPGPLNL